MKSIPGLIIIFIAILPSCNTQKNVSPPQISGGSEELYMYQWELEELNGKPVAANLGAKLAFTPGQVNSVTGHTSCNNLNGTIELGADHSLRFSPLAVTRKACMGANVEQDFLSALVQTRIWSISNAQLQLIADSRVIARFKGVNPQSAAIIPGELKGNWTLEYIAGTNVALDSLYPDKKPTIIYQGGSEYQGNTSCNGMGGKLRITETGIAFEPPITTMMACPGDGEQTFLRTLNQVDRFENTDGKLILKSKDVVLMRFRKE